jgi:hypothetical protein
VAVKSAENNPIMRGKMSYRFVIVAELNFEDPPQMLIIPDNDVVQEPAANASDDSLHETILPRTPRCSSHLLNAYSLNSRRKAATMDSIAILYQLPFLIPDPPPHPVFPNFGYTISGG